MPAASVEAEEEGEQLAEPSAVAVEVPRVEAGAQSAAGAAGEEATLVDVASDAATKKMRQPAHVELAVVDAAPLPLVAAVEHAVVVTHAAVLGVVAVAPA